MANLPFAVFNLGAQELIILLVLAVVGLGVVGAIVAAAVFAGRGSRSEDDRND
jgi:hypothetical protein